MEKQLFGKENVCGMVFDTETTNCDSKPFCYNVGWVIINNDGEIVAKRDYVVEQIWHNIPLFSTAYYAEKRPLYVKAMRSRATKMDKWGYIMGAMCRDIKRYNVQYAYAHNSPFDDRVFDFNTDYFHTKNPLDTITLCDIRGFAMSVLENDEDFKAWCEENNALTESGNYSTTAENLYRYIMGDNDFIEAHTALADSIIEAKILAWCAERGEDITQPKEAKRALWRNAPKWFTLKVDGKKCFETEYIRKTVKGDTIYLSTKTKN